MRRMQAASCSRILCAVADAKLWHIAALTANAALEGTAHKKSCEVSAAVKGDGYLIDDQSSDGVVQFILGVRAHRMGW